MKLRYKALLSLVAIISGGLIAGIAYTEPIFGPGFGTFIFCLGDFLIMGGGVLLLIVFIEFAKRGF